MMHPFAGVALGSVGCELKSTVGIQRHVWGQTSKQLKAMTAWEPLQQKTLRTSGLHKTTAMSLLRQTPQTWGQDTFRSKPRGGAKAEFASKLILAELLGQSWWPSSFKRTPLLCRRVLQKLSKMASVCSHDLHDCKDGSCSADSLAAGPALRVAVSPCAFSILVTLLPG